MLFIAQTVATIAKSQSHSQNVFLNSKKGSFQWLEFSSECHRFHTGKFLSASYCAISGTIFFWWNHSKGITRMKYGLNCSSYQHWALCIYGSLWPHVISAKSLLLYCLDWMECVTQKLVIKWKPLNFCQLLCLLVRWRGTTNALQWKMRKVSSYI